MSAPDCAIDIWSAVRHRLKKGRKQNEAINVAFGRSLSYAVFFFTAVLTFQSNGACIILFYAEGNTEASFFLSFFYILL